jgi:hypothetical protein
LSTLNFRIKAITNFCDNDATDIQVMERYDALAIVWAALRAVQCEETLDTQVSGYYIANKIAETHRGMMITIPAPSLADLLHHVGCRLC